MKIKDIIKALEEFAHPSIQESYDNAGLLVGDPYREVQSALLTIDVIPEVIEEAIRGNHGIIISHHPLVFSGLKRLTGRNWVERTVIQAVKNDIAIYASHTNMDAVTGGVNSRICQKLGLRQCMILAPMKDVLCKLVTFIPPDYAEKVRDAVFSAGAGKIGAYDKCSFNTTGQGTFRASDKAKPFTGKKGELHYEEEIRFETVFPRCQQNNILRALLNAHPYEEVAYDIYSLDNSFGLAGAGMIGTLSRETDEFAFLKKVKRIFGSGIIRHTKPTGRKVKKIAVCGGSGSSLLGTAISAGADVFVTADFKYHQFFDADNRILVADIGHYESEQFTKEIFYEILNKKFPNFALHFSEINTNPVNYL
ncbi:MAG: Nif3-like dinuclear metal center hexameric protein [Bacteroidetes bacterium]|nr:Nif3-like dinuclear metal center hexameric protein [Bacteroidota bacterium]